MDLKLQTINGDVHQVSIESSNSLLELYEAVARALDVNPWTLRLTAGTTFFDVATDGETTLEALGIKEETDLIALRCKVCFLENPGESRYNANYVCTVLHVRQEGWNRMEVEFSVRGDGSLGRLQKPKDSQLRFIDDTGERRFVLPESVNLEVDQDVKSGPSHKKGIMTFGGVPTDGGVSFVYGAGGYAPLAMNLSLGRE
ncbi:unnamed protein product [Symbiodinium microadriaticum]|nr:unnamed protein product [Symbiodinium microadriaticum]